jgi:hypothetical protein
MLGRSLQKYAKRIEARLDPAAFAAKAQPSAQQKRPPLVETVNRLKARWLKRVMYETDVSSTAKCLAYAVSDHLNCVSLDCWPSQARLAKLLGKRSMKTLSRATRELEERDVLITKRDHRGRTHYAPTFLPADEDISAPTPRHNCPETSDRNGRESLLANPSPEESISTLGSSKVRAFEHYVSGYDRRQRGAIEIQLASMLGRNGMAILERLARYDDAIVDRLCRAYAEEILDERCLHAVRLAGEQM